ncbi:hypothetical protein B9J78_04070 [bacterium Unc6]|nr:hypothetical protein [bacterium Unc6]
MVDIIKLRLRNIDRKICCLTNGLQDLKPGRQVVIQDEGCFEHGSILSYPEKMYSEKGKITKKVIRLLTEKDKIQIEENSKKAQTAFLTCKAKIEEMKMNMKLIHSEYSLDRTKLAFYFKSEKRIDFRELVQELSTMFKAKIELRQIGVRDEATIYGGCGKCGRELCCATFLKDIESVTMRLARDQNLPLNPSKISGICGKLMCCLEYEHDVYCELLKGLPHQGDIIKTNEGEGKVVQVDILKRTVNVLLQDERQINVVYR